MMSANLVGFVIGMKGIRYMLDQLIGTTEGPAFISSALQSTQNANIQG